MNTRLSLLMVLALLFSSAWLPGPRHAAADPAPPAALTATEWQAIQDQFALLVAPDGGVDHHFGNSVSVSGDTAIVGSPGSYDGKGDAYVFYRDEGGTDAWGRIARIHAQFPSDGDRFGHSVSLSADSLAAIVGAPYDAGGQGAAYVFYANYGVLWGTCSPPADAYQFGTSVSVSEYTALVGAPWNLEGQGRAFVCSGSQNSWSVDAELIPADGQQPGDQFGSSVSIHGDTAVVGAPRRYNGGNVSGAAYLYYRDLGGPNAWGQAAKRIAPDDTDGGDFGASVSVDGDAVAIGSEIGFKGADAAKVVQSEAGTAYVFYRDLGGVDAWGLAATLNPGESPWALLFGHSVSVSGDRAVVGAPWAEVNYYAQGAAYVYILPHHRIYLPLVMRTHAP